MMWKIIKALSVITGMWFTTACSGVPGLQNEPVDSFAGNTVSIAYLKSLYPGRAWQVDNDLHIRARVVSSDRDGNFYRTIMLEDATGGIAVRVELEEYFKVYWLGDVVVMNCNSLILGEYGGLVQIGGRSGDAGSQLGSIPESVITSVMRIEKKGDIRDPSPLDLSSLDCRYVCCSVVLEDVQFLEHNVPWSEEDADTDRHLVDRNGNTLKVRTSRYASFAGHPVPEGSGAITGVLGYFNGEYQFTVNYISDVMFYKERF